MLLSIVMMVKNEDRILDRMLRSLEELRKKIDSELIILDTGSTDKTVDISKKYTDKVYFEKWDDDFSSMRNKSISYAKGKWILVLDADEVLIDCSKLINFFKSNEKNIYNCGTIRIKNLYTSNKKKFGYCSIPRLFKREGFKYEGIIHEQPLYKNPIYNDVLEVEHYGYLFEDEEFRINKIKRNEKLLLNQLEKSPNDPYVNYQMGKNFVAEANYIEARYYFEKSYKLYKKIGILPEYIYINLCKTYIILGKFEECEKLCKSYIKKDKNNIDIYYYLSQSQLGKHKTKEAIEYLDRYVFLVDNYELSTSANGMFSDCETYIFRDNAIVSIISCMNIMENYSGILENYNKIIDKTNRSDCYFQLFNALHKLNKFDQIFEYYNEISKINSDKKKFYNALEVFLDGLENEKKISKYKLLANMEGNYGILNKARYENKIDINKCKEILNSEKEKIYGCLLALAIECNYDIYEIIEGMDSFWIELYLQYAINYNRKVLINLYKYVSDLQNTFEFEKLRIYRIVCRAILNNNSLSEDKYYELFYIENMYTYLYLKYLYKDFTDEDIIKLSIDIQDRFAIEFRRLVQNNYTDKEKVKIIKLLLIEYPHYKKVLENLINKLIKEINHPEELNILKREFIQNITKMMNNDNLEEANNMIDEYLEIFDYSAEILNIKGVIEYIKGNEQYADKLFKKALSLDLYNEDIIYNIESLNI